MNMIDKDKFITISGDFNEKKFHFVLKPPSLESITMGTVRTPPIVIVAGRGVG